MKEKEYTYKSLDGMLVFAVELGWVTACLDSEEVEDIRDHALDFIKSKGYKVVGSGPLELLNRVKRI